MIRTITLGILLAAVSFLLYACGSGSPDAPDDGDDGPTGSLYAIPPFHVLSHCMNLQGVWANELATITVGEMGMVFITTSAGRFLLPTDVNTKLNDVWVSTMRGVFVVGDAAQAFSAGVAMRFEGDRRIAMWGLNSDVPAVHGYESRAGVYVYAATNTYIHNWGNSGYFDQYGDVGIHIYDVWSFPNEHVYVGAMGGVYLGGGLSDFGKVYDGTTGPYYGVSGIAVDSVMAVGGAVGNYEIVWLAGTENDFERVYSSDKQLLDICWADHDWAVAVGKDGANVLYDGDRWISLFIDPSLDLRAVAAWKVDSEKFAVAVGDSGAVFRYANDDWEGGASPRVSWNDFMGVSPSVMYAIGDGRLFRYDGGWSREPLAGNLALTDLYCLAEDSVWAIGRVLMDNFVASYDGASWVTHWIASLETANDIWAADFDHVFVACDFGTVYSSVGSWAPMSVIQPVQHLRGIWGSSPTSVYVVGENGTICRWNGSMWTPMASGTTEHLLAIHGSSEQNIVAVGANGTVLRNAGNEWTAMHPAIDDSLTLVWCDGPDNIWAASPAGAVIHFDGAGWMRTNTQLNLRAYDTRGITHNAIWGAGEDLYIATDDGFLLQYRQAPTTLDDLSLW